MIIYINAQVVNGDEKGRRVCYRNIEHNANNYGGNVFADLEYCWTRAPPEGFNNHMNATNATYATYATDARKR